MKTKYDVGQEIYIKVKVNAICIKADRIEYVVFIDGHGNYSFDEDELSEVLDLSDMEK